MYFSHNLLHSSDLGVFGCVPQSVIDDEEDFLKQSHAMNSDLVCYWHYV